VTGIAGGRAGPGLDWQRLPEERAHVSTGTPLERHAPPPAIVAPDVDITRQLVALNRIARIATQDLALRPMLQRIVDALHEDFGWDFIACATIDREAGTFTCEALYSDTPSEITVGYSRRLGSGVVGTVAQDGVTIALDDVRNATNFIDTLHGTASELCVPVRHEGEVIAVLNVESRRPAAFRHQRVLLETIAEQIAGALHAARLHAELQRRADLFAMMSELSRTALEAPSFEQTLEFIARFIHARFALEICGIFLAGQDGRLALRARVGPATRVSERGGLPDGPSVTLRAFRTGEPQYVPDVHADPDYFAGSERVRSELALPIRLQGRLLGVISMQSAVTESFSADNRGMLEALAAQVAGAIHVVAAARRLGEVNRLLEDRSLELQSANAQLRQANVALERLSQRDGLTGIANRRRFDARLAALWRMQAGASAPMAVLLIDIDHFKAYNDGYGHLAGDDCLRRVAGALTTVDEEVARYGGEEFALLALPADFVEMGRIAHALHGAVAALGLEHLHCPAGRVSVSVGAAMVDNAATGSAEELVARADAALYAAKHAGRDRVELDG
jgi:diguanylate cyclase (GGDEF)-like protein